MTPAGDILTVPEAAREYRVSASAIYRALGEGRLPGFKILGRWRLRRSELEERTANARVPRSAGESDPMPGPRRGRFGSKVVELEGRRA